MKDRLSIKKGNNFIYTLGQISSEFTKIVVIETPLEDDLVKASNISEYKILSSIKLLDLSQLGKDPMDFGTKLESGSKVRYEQGSYQVAGIFKNSYAQTFIKSPILLQPFSIFNDVKSSLYSTLSENEIMDNINKNFRDGKYDADILFRFIDANNYKEKLYGIKSPPPFSSLDDIKLIQDVDVDVSTFEGIVTNGTKMRKFIEDDFDFQDITYEFSFRKPATYDDEPEYDNKKIDVGGNIAKEYNPPFKVYNIDMDNNTGADNYINYSDYSKNGVRPLLATFRFSYDYEIIDLIGQNGSTLSDLQGKNRVGLVDFSIPSTISQLLFSGTKKLFLNSDKILDEFFDDYVNLRRSGRPSVGIISSEKSNNYILIEGTKIGDFTFSSKLHLKESVSEEDYSKLLDFGSVVSLRKSYHYVVTYFKIKNGDIYCLLLKANGEKYIDTKTEFKKQFKIVKFDDVHRFFEKDGFTIDAPSSRFYTTKPQSTTTEFKKDIVTDLFLNKKGEQLERIRVFNPNLFNSVLLATKLLDKKIEKGRVKPKRKISKSPFLISAKSTGSTRIKYFDPRTINIEKHTDTYDFVFEKYGRGEFEKLNPSNFTSYNVKDSVWKAVSVTHYGTSVGNHYSQFFDIKDIQDFITSSIYIQLLHIGLTDNRTDILGDFYISNEDFGFNQFYLRYNVSKGFFGVDSWRDNQRLFLTLNEGGESGREFRKNIIKLISDNRLDEIWYLSQNIFSIMGLFNLSAINKRFDLADIEDKNYNRLFSKFNLKINFKSLANFVGLDEYSRVGLVFGYPELSDVLVNKYFAPNTKELLIKAYNSTEEQSKILKYISVGKTDYTKELFESIIKGLVDFCPDEFKYIKEFTLYPKDMGINEYEEIEIEEEIIEEPTEEVTEDMTDDIDDIFADTFEEEIDDIFADTF